jgi:putative transcriptional regulator
MYLNHHPSEELLFDYASGGISEAWGLSVATHLAFCSECRDKVAEIEAIGGCLLDSLEFDQKVEGSCINPLKNLQNVKADHSPERAIRQKESKIPMFPEPLRSYVGSDLGEVKWKRLGLGVLEFKVPTKDQKATVRLLKIPAGVTIPAHSHNGVELTQVISGAFTDETGYYGRGDFQETDESLTHQPHVSAEETCICLTVTSQPLKFKSFAVKAIQPFLGV